MVAIERQKDICRHYIMSIRHFQTPCSVNKTLFDAIQRPLDLLGTTVLSTLKKDRYICTVYMTAFRTPKSQRKPAELVELHVVEPARVPPGCGAHGVEEIGWPRKSNGHHIVSKSVLFTLYTIKKCLIDAT